MKSRPIPDQHGQSAKSRVITLLYGSTEGIHIHMGNAAKLAGASFHQTARSA